MTASAPSGISAPRANISGYKVRNAPNFTPEQMNLLSQLIGGAQGGLGGGLDFLSRLAGGEEGAFEQSEAPAYTAFNKAIGQLGSRFAGLGALGSSGFQQATSGAAGELAENLASKRLGIQQGATDRLLSLSQNLLGQKPYDTFLEKKQRGGFGGEMLGKILPLLLQLL